MHEDEILIAEDEVDEQAIAAETIAACEDDVDPPERSDRVPLAGLSINLLGVNYSSEPEFDEGEDEPNEVGDENAGSYKVGEAIGGQILDSVGENPTANKPDEQASNYLSSIHYVRTYLWVQTTADAPPPETLLPQSQEDGIPDTGILADGPTVGDLILDDYDAIFHSGRSLKNTV